MSSATIYDSESAYSSDSSYITEARETNLCHVFVFPDHLQTNNHAPFIAKATQQLDYGDGM